MSMTDLEARMNRMETMMEQLLTILSTSGSEMQKVKRMQTMLQELHDGRGTHTAGTADITLPAVTPPERPVNRAIQEAYWQAIISKLSSSTVNSMASVCKRPQGP